MQIHSAMLLTDWLMWILVVIAVIALIATRNNPQLRAAKQQIGRSKVGIIALVILSFYIATGLLDCVHLRFTYANQSTKVVTLLDLVAGPIAFENEKTYSEPFATHLYSKSLVTVANGTEVRKYAPLKYVDKSTNLLLLISIGALIAIVSFSVVVGGITKLRSLRHKKSTIAWREALVTFFIFWLLICIAFTLSRHYHILGTDKIGQDTFYLTIKSIRTGLIIGTLTTLFMLPFALILGTMAGYFGGWVDDVIQYLYTTLSSIPGVLLISATILVLQVYINNHTDLFPTLLQRADARLLALCIILGITSWASLCRLLRGETLKVRELEFVTAAKSLGTRHYKILLRHILPNVMHIVIITLVLDFSGLVLAEAVLSYVGVGVDPTTISWGNMINSSRLELAREPIVWWPLLASLIFMFLLVIAANLFADTVRDAFDPRIRQMD